MKSKRERIPSPVFADPVWDGEGLFPEPIDLPDTVEEIHSKAFFGCINLTKLKLSKSLKTVKKKAFDNCKNLQTIIVPQTISYKTLSSWRIPSRKIIRPKN